jgi:uncharacterized membrane protein
MSSAANAVRPRPRYRAILGIFRVIFVTFLATLLAFCIGLFFGIVGVVLTKMIRGTSTPSMAAAYRHVALPIAVAALVVTFIVALISEIRHYQAERQRDRLAPRTRAA